MTHLHLPQYQNAKNVVGKWVFTVKDNARYVAKGYSQITGLDYNETFSPTANDSTI